MLYFRSILIVLQKRPFSERHDRSLENLVTPSLNSRFFGADCQSRRGRRGEEWSGDACVAHGGRWEAAGEQDAGRPKGPHPSSLPPPPLRDLGTNPLPCSFHKIPTLERVTPWGTNVDLIISFLLSRGASERGLSHRLLWLVLKQACG